MVDEKINDGVGNEVLERYRIHYVCGYSFDGFCTIDGEFFRDFCDAISYSEEVLGMNKCCKFMTSKK